MIPPPTHPANAAHGTAATTGAIAHDAPVDLLKDPTEGGGGSMIPPPTHPPRAAQSHDAIGADPCEDDDAEPQVWDGTGRGEAVRGT